MNRKQLLAEIRAEALDTELYYGRIMFTICMAYIVCAVLGQLI